MYQFCNAGINKFSLMLRKGVYLYKYIDSWKKINETSLPEKEKFYSYLNMEDITNADYIRMQKEYGLNLK